MRKIICAVLTLVMMLSLLPMAVSAAGSGEELSLDGTGQRLDPYQISSVEDLCELRDRVNEGEDFSGTYFEQTCDLDLSGIANWIPIGQWETDYHFDGIYNGNGHVISNLTIVEGTNTGLFGRLGGSVMNLGIESGEIHGAYVGSIASHAVEGAKIINCYSLANLYGIRTGGIVDNFAGGVVIDCWFGGQLMGTQWGGISSYAAEMITNCTSLGSQPIPGSFLGMGDLIHESPLTAEAVNELKAEFADRVMTYVAPLDQVMQTALEGEGTEEDPLRITSLTDLLHFRSLVNSGCTFASYWVRQETDLDLAEAGNFVAIGNYGSGTFAGVYDGAGHTISNLYMCGNNTHVALFGSLAGTVMNLGVESGWIEGDYAAGIAVKSAGSMPMIINCYNNADVVGYEGAAGIAFNFSAGVIANCLNRGNVTSGEDLGGIAYAGARRVINSCSLTGKAYADLFEGVVEYPDEEPADLSQAAQMLNDGLYHIATLTNYQHNNLYRWNEDGTFGELQNYTLRFVIQEVIIAVIFFGVVALIWLCWQAAKASGSVSTAAMAGVMLEKKHRFRRSMNERIRVLICSGFVLGFGMYLIGIINGDSVTTKSFFWPDSIDMFMDFINPMSTVLKNNYAQEGYYTDVKGTYPPIARGLFWLIGQIMPYETSMLSATAMRTTTAGLFAVFMFMLLCCIGLLAVYIRLANCGTSAIPIFAIICSPMLFAFERGNIVVLIMMLCALFVAGYQSRNNLIRHLSYIFLALAASIKIYPAALGLLLLKEKNWKHILQCVGYGLAFCILPFFFIGGSTELMLYIRNVTNSFGKNAVNANSWLLNYTNVMASVGEAFLSNGDIGRQIANSTLYPLMGLLVLSGLITKEHWKTVMAAMLIIVLFPGYSVYYCAAFYCVPMMCFIAEKRTRKIDYVYAVLFLLMLVPLQFLCGALGWTHAGFWLFAGIVGLVFAALLICDCLITGLVSLFRWLKNRKEMKRI